MNDYEAMWNDLKAYCERAEKELYDISKLYESNESERKRVEGKADGAGMVLLNMKALEKIYNIE